MKKPKDQFGTGVSFIEMKTVMEKLKSNDFSYRTDYEYLEILFMSAYKKLACIKHEIETPNSDIFSKIHKIIDRQETK